jgi:hypothetical protein
MIFHFKVVFFKKFTQNYLVCRKVETSNVRVIARFRPLGSNEPVTSSADLPFRPDKPQNAVEVDPAVARGVSGEQLRFKFNAVFGSFFFKKKSFRINF